jgi:hypothetical protein
MMDGKKFQFPKKELAEATRKVIKDWLTSLEMSHWVLAKISKMAEKAVVEANKIIFEIVTVKKNLHIFWVAFGFKHEKHVLQLQWVFRTFDRQIMFYHRQFTTILI